MAGSGAVEFEGEDALPATKLEFLVHNIEHLRGRKKEGFAVRVAVLAFAVAHINGANVEIVVVIFYFLGRDALEHFLHVSDEEGFRFVYNNRHGRMEALDIHDAVCDAGLFDGREDIIRDIDEFKRRFRCEIDDVVCNFHRNSGRGE